MCGSCDQDEGRKGVQQSTERINRREKTSWKTQRKMVTCSGQECYENIEMLELERVGEG